MLAALAAVVMLALTSCTSKVTSIREPKGQENFINACRAETDLKDGAQVTIPLASEDYCRCVVDKLLNTYKISDEDFTAWEKRIDANDNLTKVPDEVKKSMSACTQPGPAAPSTSSTSTPPA